MPAPQELNPKVPADVRANEQRVEAEDRKANEYRGHLPLCQGASTGLYPLNLLAYEQDPGVTYHYLVASAESVASVDVAFTDNSHVRTAPMGGAIFVLYPGDLEIRDLQVNSSKRAFTCTFGRIGGQEPLQLGCHG
jgi:hypothetical protein